MPRPWISTNLAISADGKITSAHRQRSVWTSRDDHARLQELRQLADALMVGKGALETDQMTLTVPGKAVQPLRCIISKHGRIDPDHPVFLSSGGEIHLLATETPHPQPLRGATIHHQSLATFIETLATRYSVKHLHCEGGGTLIRTLAELDLIDEFHLTLAGHTLFGGLTAPTATGVPCEFLPKSLHFDLIHFDPRPQTGECFLSYRRTGNPASADQ
jgi:2,5-diamino-6-(ribosylamino)-4(3H)-pyrimidinone 5'-phosphate reductase